MVAHILVGGGTGFVGRRLVHCLKSSGSKVQIITRKPRGDNPDHISWDQIKQKGLPQQTTAVVNLAGLNIFSPTFWTESFKKQLRDSRIDTNRTLVEAIHKAPVKPKSFVTVSGVGFYAPSQTREYDEEWTQPKNKHDLDYLMRLARDWEKSSELSEAEAPSTRRVVIRSGVVLGRDGGVMQNLMVPFSLGLGGPLGSGKQWFPWIHVDDLAEMFKFAIMNDHVTGVINGVAPNQVTNQQFTDCLAGALNRPAIITLPPFMLRALYGSERADIVLKGQRVKSRASLLGFRYRFSSLQEAINECVGKG